MWKLLTRSEARTLTFDGVEVPNPQRSEDQNSVLLKKEM